jgi:predicted GNAT family acetyltransferase
VACAADTSRTPLIGHLSSVATAPDQRRKGYGGALIAWVARQYVEEGAEIVTLGMYADNTAGRRLYEQLGFACEHAFTSTSVGPA